MSDRIGVPPGWTRSGPTVMTRGEFRIAWARIGTRVRFIVSRVGEERVVYRDDVKAALSAVDEWEQGGSGR